MSEEQTRAMVKIPISPERGAELNRISDIIDQGIGELELSYGEHLSILVLLSMRFIRHTFDHMPEGAMTVETIADSLRDSTVRSWKKTAERGDQ